MQLFGGIFFLTTNMFMGNFFNAVLVFQAERPVFLREYANKTYDIAPYYFAKLLVDTPIMLLTPLIGTLIVYFSVGLERSAEQFFSHYIVLTFCALSSASFGYLLSAMFEND